MSSHSDDEDCFASINIDGRKLMLTIGTECIGIKFDAMGDYLYVSFPEANLLVHAIQAAAARARLIDRKDNDQ